MNMTTETPTTADQLLEDILKEKADLKEDEAPDLDKLSKKAPPREGICRRCGEDRPINRLMLCYTCWVKTNLEESGWREGMPHPAWCHCETSGSHPERRSAGN